MQADVPSNLSEHPPLIMPRRCARCEYPLDGLGDAGDCPECGYSIDESIRHAGGWTQPRLERLKRAGYAYVISYVAAVLLAIFIIGSYSTYGYAGALVALVLLCVHVGSLVIGTIFLVIAASVLRRTARAILLACMALPLLAYPIVFLFLILGWNPSNTIVQYLAMSAALTRSLFLFLSTRWVLRSRRSMAGPERTGAVTLALWPALSAVVAAGWILIAFSTLAATPSNYAIAIVVPLVFLADFVVHGVVAGFAASTVGYAARRLEDLQTTTPPT